MITSTVNLQYLEDLTNKPGASAIDLLPIQDQNPVLFSSTRKNLNLVSTYASVTRITLFTETPPTILATGPITGTANVPTGKRHGSSGTTIVVHALTQKPPRPLQQFVQSFSRHPAPFIPMAMWLFNPVLSRNLRHRRLLTSLFRTIWVKVVCIFS